MNTAAIGKTKPPAAIGKTKPPAANGKAHKPPAIETPKPVAPVVTEPVGPLHTQPVGELRLDPSLPGAQQTDVEAEAAREQFLEKIGQVLTSLKAEGRRRRIDAEPKPVLDLAVALEQLLVDAAVAPNHGLSATAQQKLDSALKMHRRKLEREFEELVREACKTRMEELNIPSYFKRLDEIEQMFTWPRNSVMTKSQYNAILRCLHPDGLNSRTEAQLAEAFRIFTHYKPKMVADEDERKNALSDLPSTREELLARKKKRAHKTNAGRVPTTT